MTPSTTILCTVSPSSKVQTRPLQTLSPSPPHPPRLLPNALDSKLNYYGTTLATASSDRSIKIFELGATYAHTGTLTSHTGPVWEVSWAHPKFGSLLASASFDGQCVVHRESPARNWQVVYKHSNER